VDRRPEPVWTTWRREKSNSYRDSKSYPSAVQLVARRYSYCARPALRKEFKRIDKLMWSFNVGNVIMGRRRRRNTHIKLISTVTKKCVVTVATELK
jgi:hypothetical protein